MNVAASKKVVLYGYWRFLQGFSCINLNAGIAVKETKKQKVATRSTGFHAEETYRASGCEGSSRDGKRGNNSRSKHCSRWTGEWRVFPKICTGIFVPTIYFQTNAVLGTNSKKLINIESYRFLAIAKKEK